MSTADRIQQARTEEANWAATLEDIKRRQTILDREGEADRASGQRLALASARGDKTAEAQLARLAERGGQRAAQSRAFADARQEAEAQLRRHEGLIERLLRLQEAEAIEAELPTVRAAAQEIDRAAAALTMAMTKLTGLGIEPDWRAWVEIFEAAGLAPLLREIQAGYTTVFPDVLTHERYETPNPNGRGVIVHGLTKPARTAQQLLGEQIGSARHRAVASASDLLSAYERQPLGSEHLAPKNYGQVASIANDANDNDAYSIAHALP